MTKFSGVSYLPAFMLRALGANKTREKTCFQSAISPCQKEEKTLLHLSSYVIFLVLFLLLLGK